MFNFRQETGGRYIQYEGITFEVIRRDVRYFRVEFRGRIPRMVLPRFANEKKVLRENFNRIRKKYNKYLKQVQQAMALKWVPRSEDEFAEIVRDRISLFSDELKVKVKGVKFRKMKRMWGNCRNTGVITLNSRLSLLPDRIISYIIYHEVLHLAERGGHTVRFRSRMREKYPDMKRIEAELSAWFIKFGLDEVN